MSLCPVCGRNMCDHTSKERGQTQKEMMRPLSEEEKDTWRNNPSNSSVKIAMAQKHKHDPV